MENPTVITWERCEKVNKRGNVRVGGKWFPTPLRDVRRFLYAGARCNQIATRGRRYGGETTLPTGYFMHDLQDEDQRMLSEYMVGTIGRQDLTCTFID